MANVKKELPKKFFTDKTKRIILKNLGTEENIAALVNRSRNMVGMWLDRKAVIPAEIARDLATICGIDIFDIRPDLKPK